MLCLPAAQEYGGTQQTVPVRTSPTTPATKYTREMRYLDADGDMNIDAKELAAGQHRASMILMLSWEECDRDADGVISPVEFQYSAQQAMQELREANSESALQAEDALAKAITLKLLLERLAYDELYAHEIAALREAIEDLDDEEAVVTYVVKYPTRYPRLTPVIYTWGRHYPVRPNLHRLVKPRPIRLYRPPAKAKPVRPIQPGPKKAPKPIKKKARPRKGP
jgi:hypothetical protein